MDEKITIRKANIEDLQQIQKRLEEYIEQLKPYVIDLFKKDSSGHDISHLIRTMNLALSIQEKEGGDRIVIGIAAFLHDIHRIMQSTSGKFVEPKDSIDTVRKI